LNDRLKDPLDLVSASFQNGSHLTLGPQAALACKLIRIVILIDRSAFVNRLHEVQWKDFVNITPVFLFNEASSEARIG